MKSKMLDLLYNKGYLNNEDIDGSFSENFSDNIYTFIKQTQDNIIYYNVIDLENFEMNENNQKVNFKEEIISITKSIMKKNRLVSFFMIFENWEQERMVYNSLLAICSNASERKLINDIFDFMDSIYSNNKERLFLEVDKEGINYLEYSTYEEDNKHNVTAEIYNLSIAELKKLYNLTGVNLFKLNLRIGIQNKKAGKELKEEFKKYLKVGILEFITSSEKSKEIKDYLLLNESIIEKYKPKLFWYNHNGINIFVNDESDFEIEGKHIVLNPHEVSVINGAQTLTNIFLAKEELLKDLKGFNEETNFDFDKIIELILERIIVKTVFIKANSDLSKSITRGLNNQIPIKIEDTVTISKEVEDLNDLLRAYQMKILRTGENENIYKGFSALKFMKLYLNVKGKPGTSKNFNKKDLQKDLEYALDDIKDDKIILEKINLALEVEEWWEKKNKETIEKSLFLRYGRNYFQSYVINVLEDKDKLNSLIETDLEVFYDVAEKILTDLDADINDYKGEDKFEELIKIPYIYENSTDIDEIVNSLEDLKIYLKNNLINNYSARAVINRFNKENELNVIYFRTISIVNGRLKESFPLPNSTFEEFYKRDSYMKDDDEYPEFENSILKKEVTKEYPLYILHFDINRKIIKVEFNKRFSLGNGSDWEEDAKKVFEKVKEAFVEGEVLNLPKMSDNDKFHVRPKAINGEDTFQFTDGSSITKRTFWANAKYVQSIMNI